MGQLALDMSLAANPTISCPYLRRDPVCPLLMFLHGGTVPLAPHSSSPGSIWEKKGAGSARPVLDVLSAADSPSVGHMCPVCLCHVVRGFSLWGRTVVFQLCKEWLDKFI